ncbi:hypothetical protein H6G20_16585 [Desertifilum sp. FACHB-1129]|uniref:Uncharacterized protein n=1 Tax=Geitlerinema calcuttense NRMC-F 0142 TaxID=2922238 RepID=A0ABT7LWJ3_9CYAN|nr:MULTISPECIES: hypothetical protein [Cyanophyceae]MCD8485554.1 hypothetical protein [Desertifilum sp.]MDA0211989.1 hypothetical protein [Cyanobacteria bacterium FC1]MDI9638150.1 hypothetical protein [Geitlerinema splendidum]MDK3157264.1 hypothetical protein [Kamptonema cortianum]MBD2313285.1 hypothetical protein [Desertifilum sp. FACHB-1129]
MAVVVYNEDAAFGKREMSHSLLLVAVDLVALITAWLSFKALAKNSC